MIGWSAFERRGPSSRKPSERRLDRARRRQACGRLGGDPRHARAARRAEGRRAVKAPLLAAIIFKSYVDHAFVEFVGARPGEGPLEGCFPVGSNPPVAESRRALRPRPS
jgi:hypothetical protein